MKARRLLLFFCISVYCVLTETLPQQQSQDACVLSNQISTLVHNRVFNDTANISLPVSRNRECSEMNLEIFMNASKRVAVRGLSEDSNNILIRSIYYNLKEIKDSLIPDCKPEEPDCKEASFPSTQFGESLNSFLRSIHLCLSNCSQN